MARQFYAAKMLFDMQGSYFHIVNTETGANESIRPSELTDIDGARSEIEQVLQIKYIFSHQGIHFFEKEVE